jgi:hypothetical protein
MSPLLAPLDMKPGTFYDIGSGFMLPIQEVPFHSKLEIQSKLSVSCMFDIFFVSCGGTRVGFFFVTRFEVQNEGGYLITYLQNKGKATEVEVLIKTEDLVVYNYPNRGTLAISPLVNPIIETIFEEQ